MGQVAGAQDELTGAGLGRVGDQRGARGLRVVPVAGEERRAAEQDLTRGTGGVAILVAGLVALTAGELFQSAGCWGLSFALAPDCARAEYLATFNLGTSAQFVLGPAIVTVAVVGNGTAGWLAMAGAFLLTGAVAGPLVTRAQNRVLPEDGSAP
ncbi:hypothetical protein AB0I69_45305 [Streptomyces sp. NPDC050508]|uniref:hypothetical protein n=1 Tax=Streptomyces sp. NPDC050508 TaxID=3155405 RepID=UPI00343862BE